MYDIIVIGGGAGGLTVAAGAASLGAKTAIIEKRESLGGDCLHYGCVPSKALIEAANEIYTARNVAYAGVKAEGKVDLGKVMKRVQESVTTIEEHDSIERFESLGVDVYLGAPEFTENRELFVNGEVLRGKKIVIATGSTVNVPPVEGLEEADYWTNETVFQQTELPERMAFIGAGPVGLEIAQSFARLGTDVTVFEGGATILKKEDRAIQKKAMEILEREMTIVTDARVQKVSSGSGETVVHYTKDGKEETLSTDRIFLAAGRKPNTEGLNLSQGGIVTNEKGFIDVDETLRTENPNVFAIGDVTGEMPFTHVAGEHGKLVVQNALFSLKRRMSYEAMPWNTYITPEIFHIGRTQEEAAEEYEDILVYETQLQDVDRFVSDHASEGFVKIITDVKGKILGAHAIGKGAGDWMQPVVAVMTEGKTIRDLSGMVYPYPNHAAALESTASQYWRQKLFSGVVPAVTKKVIRWLG
ncbi:dihydrolipoyl dehydrogenase family protein [Salimicrobium halophilum]|uniref:Pyruvate/2-oxoglutarate dehydrogenase complex, dihydrolipoamide dehydrogenase (E3) component n=1 Tax=Salimicrobium halophilum TaxID=86666 RepID=A0A1G8R396_9BACI|nr:FAD-dependent oxidoreductase [Salimicrobium halophilum]SDJ11442.1 Pyruvate/2-oxoglutarate dehydrogenase complex, dihydrolipoamide dehydrogenase (E3) component [Salimicrobium halophilum]